MRQVASENSISYEETIVPGEDNVIRFSFEPMDDATTRKLVFAIPREAYAPGSGLLIRTIEISPCWLSGTDVPRAGRSSVTDAATTEQGHFIEVQVFLVPNIRLQYTRPHISSPGFTFAGCAIS